MHHVRRNGRCPRAEQLDNEVIEHGRQEDAEERDAEHAGEDGDAERARISAPAPTARASGTTPRMKASEVMMIGRRRRRQASTRGSRASRLGRIFPWRTRR